MVAIIKYNAGNVQSVQYALQRIGVPCMVTDDEKMITGADKVIFPGVGHAEPAMQYLKQRGLDQLIISLKQPVLGICLGLQLLCKHTQEGDTACLGVFDTEVKMFDSADNFNGIKNSFKIPQTGWNSISGYRSDLFNGVADNAFVYYVHSYYAELCADTIATTEYILSYSAALQKDNFYGVQFHPEKSGLAGEKILSNFIQLK